MKGTTMTSTSKANCDRFDEPEPLRLLDDEDRIGGARAIVYALLMEGAVVGAVIWIWRML